MAKKTVRLVWTDGSLLSRRNLIAEIRSSFGEHELFEYGTDDSPEYIEEQMTTCPIFQDKRIFILKGLPSFASNSNKRYEKMFDQIEIGTLVIVNGVSTSSHRKLFDYVKKNGVVYIYDHYISREDAIEWVNQRFKDEKKSCDQDDIKLLITRVGEETDKGINIDKLYLSLEKLLAYVGSSKNIKQNDIVLAIDVNTEFLLWEMFGAIDKRDLNRYNSIVSQYVVSQNTVKGAVEYLLNMLTWRFRLLILLKELEAQGKSESDILSEAKSLRKLEREGQGFTTKLNLALSKTEQKPMQEYSDGMIRSSLRGHYNSPSPISAYSRGELYSVVNCLGECLHRVRRGCNDVESMLMMDNVMFTASRIFPKDVLKFLRGSTDG